MKVICDVETNALHNYTRLWLVTCIEVDTGVVHTFREPDLNSGPLLAFAKGVDTWIGHNFIGFDYFALIHFLPTISINPSSIIDSLIVSRMCNFSLDGGHSLEAFGERFGVPKVGVDVSFEEYSELLKERNIQDCRINLRLYQQLRPFIEYPQFQKAIEVEHKMAFICRDMFHNGFGFNLDACNDLAREIDDRLGPLVDSLSVEFPPKSRLVREITPRATKHGTLHLQDFRWMGEGPKDLSGYGVGQTFSLLEWVPFNPGSPKQIVERLNQAGWKPTSKTKGHITAEREADYDKLEGYQVYGWKVDEENLATLPKTAPEGARQLVQYLLLASRRRLLEGFLEAYNSNTGKIHGTINPLGAWTHRASHTNPNVGNIVRTKDDKGEPTLYGAEIRSLFRASPGRILVGVDADSIQLRILAHYMNDKRFIESLVTGDKGLGTDAHSLNKKALGHICKDRNAAKTFIYAWLLGAGVAKVSEILGCTLEQAREAMDQFLRFYPGLERLKRITIPKDASNGYIIGLDGRLVVTPSEHKVLAAYLQNGEKCIMAHANVIWRRRLIQEDFPFWQVNWVHDEWQTETIDDLTHAEYLVKVQVEAIEETGKLLKMNCPLTGEGKIGYNWLETH